MTDVIDIQNDLDACRIRVKELQNECVHFVSFSPNGKVLIVDKSALESTNNEIVRLSELSTRNSDVLAKLIDTLGGEYATVEAVRVKRDQLREQIKKTKTLLRIDIGNLLEHTPGIDPTKPLDHPKCRALQGKTDATLAVTQPLLAAIEDLLAKAEAILQDYKPSGLDGISKQPAENPFPSIIREKVGGMA